MEKNKMRTTILDGTILGNQEKAHEYLKEMLELPEYYGKNLDALYDCLTDLKDFEIQVQIEEPKSEYLKKMIHVFQDAADDNDDILVQIIMKS